MHNKRSDYSNKLRTRKIAAEKHWRGVKKTLERLFDIIYLQVCFGMSLFRNVTFSHVLNIRRICIVNIPLLTKIKTFNFVLTSLQKVFQILLSHRKKINYSKS